MCAWSFGIAALVSYVRNLMQAHRVNGSWQFDSDSGFANDKRYVSAIDDIFGAVGVFPLFDELYTVNGMPIDSNQYRKRDEYQSFGINVKSIIEVKESEIEHFAYTFIVELHDHNKSVVSEINDAIETWNRCGTSDLCRSSRNVWYDANCFT